MKRLLLPALCLLTACQSSTPQNVRPMQPEPVAPLPRPLVVVDEPKPFPRVQRDLNGLMTDQTWELTYLLAADAYSSAKLSVESCLKQANKE